MIKFYLKPVSPSALRFSSVVIGSIISENDRYVLVETKNKLQLKVWKKDIEVKRNL